MTALAIAQPPGNTLPLQELTQQILADQIKVIRHASANAPRSRQTLIGPSELGHPCVRKLAYKLMDWPANNPNESSWYSILGTAVHAWMTDACHAHNRSLGRERWICDRRLDIGAGIVCPSGSGDCYDTDRNTVIDWKITGTTTLTEVRRHGPGVVYETQLQLYGFGWERAGYLPEWVSNVFLPRSPSLPGDMRSLAQDAVIWAAPYDRSKAIAALQRGRAIADAILALDPEKHPERWGMFPMTPEKCDWCPYFRPQSTDLSQGCPGGTA
jgi:hypothetical protein